MLDCSVLDGIPHMTKVQYDTTTPNKEHKGTVLQHLKKSYCRRFVHWPLHKGDCSKMVVTHHHHQHIYIKVQQLFDTCYNQRAWLQAKHNFFNGLLTGMNECFSSCVVTYLFITLPWKHKPSHHSLFRLFFLNKLEYEIERAHCGYEWSVGLMRRER